METTITISRANRQRLAEIAASLRAERSRAVTLNEVIEYLLEARDELARRVTADYTQEITGK